MQFFSYKCDFLKKVSQKIQNSGGVRPALDKVQIKAAFFKGKLPQGQAYSWPAVGINTSIGHHNSGQYMDSPVYGQDHSWPAAAISTAIGHHKYGQYVDRPVQGRANSWPAARINTAIGHQNSGHYMDRLVQGLAYSNRDQFIQRQSQHQKCSQ